jgi:hypothetical protein
MKEEKRNDAMLFSHSLSEMIAFSIQNPTKLK